MSGRRICIVSSGCLSTGPRVVKEADALSAAGHQVHVVVHHWMPRHADWDARLATGKAWSWSAWSSRIAPRMPRPSMAAGQLLRRAARAVAGPLGPLAPLDEVAFSAASAPLRRHARRAHADLFIAHNLPALSVAADLARQRGAALAFDAEDDHLGELPTAEHGSLEARLRDRLLARYLPRCSYVTVPSEGIAEALARRYGIPRPVVVRNVFPWALRDTCDGARRDRTQAGLSLYWCSQSVGLDRGLQDAIRAAAGVRGGVQLHVRGDGPESVRDELRRLAREVGFGAERLHFHTQVHPDELLSRTMEHDVGLALEPPVSDNKRETVTNKFFLYMLAGLALAATDTEGQERVLRANSGAGFLYRAGDSAALLRGLQSFVDDRGALARAKASSLAAARERWSWEHERGRLVELVGRALPAASRAPP